MDQQTKAALKQDHFVTTTAQGLEWTSANRKSVVVTASLILGLIVLAVATGAYVHHRAEQASAAFGQAMQVYTAPVVTANQQPVPGVKTYESVQARAAAAYQLFAADADKYGMTKDGKNARYFAGITAMEQGQTQTAEGLLKQVGSGWDKDLAAVANLALADLYRQSGRDPQAIDLYNKLADKPTRTVPAATAQIALAELYTAEGKTDAARKIYAQLKDKDKDAKGAPGIASTIAAQKLNPTPAAGGPPQLQQ